MPASLSSRSGRSAPRPKRRAALRSDQSALRALADLVRAERTRHGLTQAALAGLSNTGVRFIVDLEHAKPTLAIAKVLDVLATLGLAFDVRRRQAVKAPGGES